jgi:hypothetical protein
MSFKLVIAIVLALLLATSACVAQSGKWERRVIGDSVLLRRIVFSDSQTGYAIGETGRSIWQPGGNIVVFRSDDGGVNWNRLPFPKYSADGDYYSSFFVRDSTLFMPVPNKKPYLLASEDKGASWRGVDSTNTVHVFWSDSGGIRTNYYTTDRTTNLGASWHPLPYNLGLDTMLRAYGILGWIAQDSLNWIIPLFNHYYDSFYHDFADTGSLITMRTTNGGQTWKRYDCPMPSWVFRWEYRLSTEGHWWTLISNSTQPLLYSSDLGLSWHPTPLPAIYAHGNYGGYFAYAMTSADSMFCVAFDTIDSREGNYAVWYSIDTGFHWNRDAASFIGDQLLDMFFLDQRHGWVLGQDYKNFEASVYIYRPEGIAKVDGSKESAVRIEAYPNPATSFITIVDDGPFTVRDALGRSMGSMPSTQHEGSLTVNIETLSPGCYSIRFASGRTTRFIKR